MRQQNTFYQGESGGERHGELLLIGMDFFVLGMIRVFKYIDNGDHCVMV